MIWQIKDFRFDENTKVLSINKNAHLLEPKTAAILSYFCRNPNKDISRDELMENLWQGQIVAENTINRVIVLLRKALKDEEKIKKFVITVPKVGYRFIARVNKAPVVEKNLTKANSLTLTVVTLLMSVGIAFYLNHKKPQPIVLNPNITPLTRLAGIQHQPDLAHDGKRLATSRYLEGNNDVVIVIDIDKQIPIKISQEGGSSNHAKWAHDDSFLIYIYTNATTCEFHQVDFIDKIAHAPRVIYQCPANNFSEFTISTDNTKLYFIERDSPFSPYFVYELDLILKNKRKLSQPMPLGIGNHYLDINPDTNELLMISNQKPGMSSLYVLDVKNNTFKQKLRLGYHINTAIWSHQENKIVHPAPHPSYQLMQTNLETNESVTLVSDSRRISKPNRISDKDYFFTSYLYNRDIDMDGLADNELNSNVMDYLPRLSRDAKRLAFISKRSGYSKIWIKNLMTKELISIDPPDKSRIFFNIDWSFDDKLILTNTNNGIIIFDAKTKNVVKLISPNLPVYAATWIEKDVISFSLYNKGKWLMYHYNTTTHKKQPIENRQWSMMLANSQQTLYFDQELIATINDKKIPANDLCSYSLSRYRLTFHLDGNNLYCHARDSNDILKWNKQGQLTRLKSDLKSGESFSVSQDKLVISLLKDTSSDVMRTNF